MRFAYSIITVLLALLPSLSGAETFQPVLTNYTSLQYHAGLQNWSVAQDANGLIYIGNNSGVLSFDGYNWNLSPLPGNIIARSLFCDGGRLYVGGYEEFGYMERDRYGNLSYNSLWEKVKGYMPHNDEIWNIVKTRDGRILFQSFCSWFEYDGKSVRAHYDPQRLPLYFFSAYGRVYCQFIEGDFCQLDGNRFKTIVSRQQTNDHIVALLPIGQGDMLLCTESRGILMLTRDGKLSRWATSVDPELSHLLINRAALSADKQTVAIGTILGGVIALNRQGQVMWRFNTANQLVNNSILALFFDHDNNLWAGSDTGISLIHSGSPFSLLTHTTPALGMVFDVLCRTDALYIATNQRTFLYQHQRLQPIAGTEEQNWHVTDFGNQIIVGNNHGARRIEGSGSLPLNARNPASSTCMRRFTVNAEEDYLIESSYSDLCVFKRKDGQWELQGTLKGFQAPVMQFEVDRDGTIWAAHMSKGVYRVELSGDMRRITSLHYYPSLSGLRRGSLIHVMKVRGTIILAEGGKLYCVGEDGKPKPYHELDNLMHDNIIASTPIDNKHFWLATQDGYTLIEVRGNRYHIIEDIPAAFFGLECSDISNNVRVFGGRTYFCLNGGVGRLDNAAYASRRRKRLAKLVLAGAEYISSDRKHHALPIDGSRARAKGDVTIRLSYPNFNNQVVFFRFHLKRRGQDLKSTTTKPEITYNSLEYGNYELTAEVVDGNDKVIDSVAYSFSYPRPLLLSIPAILLYVALIVLAVYMLTLRQQRKLQLKQQHIMEEEQMRQKLIVAEQQRIIEQQQQQLLEQQLKDKGKEIASLAMDGILNKQKVDDFKHELQKQKKMSPQEIGRMMRIIDESSGKDDFWDIYKENFDLIHKNFFRNLRRLYPALTATDLKFCALIRLNLNTKDIAQFTGLTVRGVEGARYRLRKKLGVARDKSLTEFLIDFSGQQDTTTT